MILCEEEKPQVTLSRVNVPLILRRQRRSSEVQVLQSDYLCAFIREGEFAGQAIHSSWNPKNILPSPDHNLVL
jgi:hypothetical protein